jgi:hypothetical protein
MRNILDPAIFLYGTKNFTFRILLDKADQKCYHLLCRSVDRMKGIFLWNLY